MERNRKVYQRMIICVSLLMIGMTGCIKEKGSDSLYELAMTIVDTDSLREAVVYLFDEKGNYTGQMSVDKEMIAGGIPFRIPQLKTGVTAVVWGNTQGGREEVNLGNTLGSSSIRLLENVGSVVSPDDLFFGTRTLLFNGCDGTDWVSLRRSVAALSITAYHLEELTSVDGSDFSYTIRSVGRGLDFAGKLIGGDVVYHPVTEWAEDGSLNAPFFILLPPGDAGLAVDIYKGTERLFASDTTDVQLRLDAGQRMRLKIDFKKLITEGIQEYLFISVEPWGMNDVH
ncbi:MAG: FimB/Mfa2 family fimbrial subunit [Odoribacter sp.]